MSTSSLTLDIVEEQRDDGKRRLVAMHGEFEVARATEYGSGPERSYLVGLTMDAQELLGGFDEPFCGIAPFVVEAPAAARSALATIFFLYSRATVAAA